MNENAENSHHLLAGVHPIFSVPSTKIFWVETVQKVNKHNKSQTRTLVIASCGIFLLEKKSFPKELVVSRTIAYSELVLVWADESSMKFFKPKVTMHLMHPRHLEAVALVLALRRALFPGDLPRPPKVAFAPDVQAAIDRIASMAPVERTVSALADRFLSMCLLAPPEALQTEQVAAVHRKLRENPKSVDFDAASISPHLISAMAAAVAYDRGVVSVHVRKVCLPYFLQHFNEIAEHNASLRNLYFHEVSLGDGELGALYELVKRGAALRANSFSFSECQLGTREFAQFFEKVVNGIAGKVKSVSFFRSKIGDENLKSVFATLAASKRCAALETLIFNGVVDNEKGKNKALYQLLGGDFLDNYQSLSCFEIANNNLHLEKVLHNVVNEKVKIRTLNLSGNVIAGDLQIRSFYGIEKINFSSIGFTSETFDNFLRSLSKCEKVPQYIVLDSLKVDKSEWYELYNRIKDISISGIKSFSWNCNQIMHEQIGPFLQFLSNLPDLDELSISSSVCSSESGQFISQFLPFINKKPLRKLEIKGSNDFILGSNLLPLLDSLLSQRFIKSLDISNQELNPEGLEILVHLSNNCLEELKFDGTGVSSFDYYTGFIEKLLESKLRFAQWPDNDIKRLLKKESSQKKSLSSKLSSLKKRFGQQYKGSLSRDSSSNFGHRRIASSSHRSKSGNQSQELVLDSIYEHDPNIVPLLLECLDLPQLLPDTEPFHLAMTSLDSATSIDAFLSGPPHF